MKALRLFITLLIPELDGKNVTSGSFYLEAEEVERSAFFHRSRLGSGVPACRRQGIKVYYTVPGVLNVVNFTNMSAYNIAPNGGWPLLGAGFIQFKKSNTNICTN